MNPPLSLILIPGFLTEPHDLAKHHQSAALNALDPTALLDRRAWVNAVRSVCSEDVNIVCFEWGSQSVIQLVSDHLLPLISSGLGGIKSNLFGVAQELHTAWRSARDEGDADVSRLCELIKSSSTSTPIYLLGHSLGGRMALKAIERLSLEGFSPLPKVVAWAPAISESELSCTTLDGILIPPEIIFSSADTILKFIFPLGQGPRPEVNLFGGLSLISKLLQTKDGQRALGLVGPSTHTKRLHTVAQDMSDQQLTHLGYLPAAEYLFKSSHYLCDLIPSSTEGQRKRLTF